MFWDLNPVVFSFLLMDWSGFIFINSPESILTLQTDSKVCHVICLSVLYYLLVWLDRFCLFSVWSSTFTVWPRGSSWDLNRILQTTLRCHSTCAFPVSVSASFPTRCSAKPPEVKGGLRTLLFISCVQWRDVYIYGCNSFTTLLQRVW